MAWWDDKASSLQQYIRAEEARSVGYSDYDRETVRQAVVHGRQDVVLLVSNLSSVNRQLRAIKWLLVATAVLLAIIALPASAQTTSTQCRWIGNVWSCDSQTQSTAPIDQSEALRAGASVVPQYRPTPRAPTPIPPPVSIADRYGIDPDHAKMIRGLLRYCPADGKSADFSDVDEGVRALVGALCYAHDQGRIARIVETKP